MCDLLLTALVASIIAVHGLNGHRIDTWTFKEKVCWLKELLPPEIPMAAIFSYGYPIATPITSVAQDLIVVLDERRMKRSSYEIPIVFVAHGTGGLIVKEVRITKDMTCIFTAPITDYSRLSHS